MEFVFVAIFLFIFVISQTIYKDRPFMKMRFGKPSKRQYRTWAKRQDEELQILIAQRTSDSDILASLLHLSNTPAMRLIMARNPQTPKHLIGLLVHDPDEEIRDLAMRHPNAPQHIQIINRL